jgi:hypothetical protein
MVTFSHGYTNQRVVLGSLKKNRHPGDSGIRPLYNRSQKYAWNKLFKNMTVPRISQFQFQIITTIVSRKYCSLNYVVLLTPCTAETSVASLVQIAPVP